MDVSLSLGNFLTAPMQRRRFSLMALISLTVTILFAEQTWSLFTMCTECSQTLHWNVIWMDFSQNESLSPLWKLRNPFFHCLNFSLHSCLLSSHQSSQLAFHVLGFSRQKFKTLPHCSYKHLERTKFRMTTAVATLLITNMCLSFLDCCYDKIPQQSNVKVSFAIIPGG